MITLLYWRVYASKFIFLDYFSLTYLKLKNGTRFNVYKGHEERSDLLRWHLGSFKHVTYTLDFITLKGYIFYDQMKYDALDSS